MIRRHLRVLDEAVRDSAAQRRQALGVISLLAILSAGLLLLSSREQFDRDQLRSQLNSPAARTVTFSISGGAAAIDDAAVGRIEELGDVEFAVGFGPATDVVNANLPLGDPVAYRSVVGDLSSIFPEADRGFSKQRALAVQPAAESLGFIDGAGSIENAAHVQRSVIGTLEPANDFAWLDQTVLGRPDSDTGLQTVVMRLTTAEAVDANAAIAIELLGVENPGSIRQEFAQALIEANAGVARLADQQRQAVKIGTLAAVTALNAVVLTTLVGAHRPRFRSTPSPRCQPHRRLDDGGHRVRDPQRDRLEWRPTSRGARCTHRELADPCPGHPRRSSHSNDQLRHLEHDPSRPFGITNLTIATTQTTMSSVAVTAVATQFEPIGRSFSGSS